MFTTGNNTFAMKEMNSSDKELRFGARLDLNLAMLEELT